MFESYLPQRFCREYVEIKSSSSQLVNFMAVVLGVKPLMDDWIPSSRWEDYQALCRSHGLHCRADSLFLYAPKDRIPADVIGRESLTTTTSYALPLEAGVRGHVHAFASRDPDLLRHGMWYSVIVRNRVIWPPRMDILRYGHLLGYPECCIRFFQAYNNWQRYSFLHEIHKRSPRLHPWCNPLGKDLTYSYIYHMPCSFSCPQTLERVARLRTLLHEREPGLVQAIDHHLTLPALVFRERRIYFFEGEARGQRIHYHAFRYEGGDPSGDTISEDLKAGDTVEVEAGHVRILQGTTLVREIPPRPTGFAPEIPFIVAFPPLQG